MELPNAPRLVVLAAALVIAAVALFFLPTLLGMIGGSGSPSGAGPSASVGPSASIVPTPTPAPTPELYTIKKGDTLSKIASAHGVTVDEILAANKDRIKNPNLIGEGLQIVIPRPSGEPSEASGSARPSASAAPGGPAGRRRGAERLPGGEVDSGDLSGRDAERRVEMERRRSRSDDEDVRLVGIARIADAAGDHPQPAVAAEKPAADTIDAAQRLGAVTDMDPHLGVLGHQPNGRLALAGVQQLEERLHRLDGSHGPSVPAIMARCRQPWPPAGRSIPLRRS
jgi:LysM repeat protein